MIRFALEDDLPALKALWQEAFEADAREAEFYFRHRHRQENMLVALSGRQVAGMLSMLPLDLNANGLVLPARYVFAVATFKAFRGQGISTGLLKAVHAHMRKTGAAASVLVPATPGLFDFYGKRGYETLFYLDSLRLSPSDMEKAPSGARITPLSAPQYLRLRNQAFSRSALYARWNQEALSFIIDGLNEPGAGGALHIETPQGEAGCLYERRDGGVRVTELALGDMPWQSALAALHQRLNAPAYTLRMPRGSLPGADQLPFGMIHWFAGPPALSGEAPYLSLAKD